MIPYSSCARRRPGEISQMHPIDASVSHSSSGSAAQPGGVVLAEHRKTPPDVGTDRVVEREVDVDGLRVQVEGVGVHVRDVQPFEEAFGNRLPVGRERRFGDRRVVLHLVAAERADLRVEVAQVGGDVDRVVAPQDDPDEAVPFLTRELDEPVLVQVEPVVAVAQRHPDEMAPGVVDPRVVRAGEAALVAATQHGLGAAVPAVVEERVGHAVLVARDQHRPPDRVADEVVVGFGDLVRRRERER